MNCTVISIAMVVASVLPAVCGAQAPPAHPASTVETVETVEAALGSITVERSREWVEALSSDRFGGRATATKGLRAASRWIAERLEQAGAVPFTGRSYFQETGNVRNILAKIEGENPDEYVFVGAHYDHVGTDPSSDEKDNIFNGADDNASGVAGVLHIARAFAEAGVKPRRTVVFALWDAEEIGLVGSRRFGEAFDEMDRVRACVNLDMIGRDPSGTEGQVLFFSTDSLGWADNAHKDAASYTPALEPITDPETLARDFEVFVFKRPWIDGPEAIVLRGNSDYVSFNRAGVPVYMVSTGLHDDYHGVDDEADRIDYRKMTDVSRLVFLTVHRLANSEL